MYYKACDRSQQLHVIEHRSCKGLGNKEYKVTFFDRNWTTIDEHITVALDIYAASKDTHRVYGRSQERKHRN